LELGEDEQEIKRQENSNGKDEKAKRQDGIVMVDGIWVQ
jgi:hypothetical protein